MRSDTNHGGGKNGQVRVCEEMRATSLVSGGGGGPEKTENILENRKWDRRRTRGGQKGVISIKLISSAKMLLVFRRRGVSRCGARCRRDIAAAERRHLARPQYTPIRCNTPPCAQYHQMLNTYARLTAWSVGLLGNKLGTAAKKNLGSKRGETRSVEK